MSGPDEWGPHGWKFIHYITLGYPTEPTNEDRNKYKNFFLSLSNVIPCVLCKMNYKQHLKEYPLDERVLKNQKNLMTWGIKVHNLVNKSNNKKIMPINKGINLIKKNDDTCKIEGFSEVESEKNAKKLKVKKFIYISPVIIFGLILIFQVIKMPCNKENEI